MFIPIWSDLLFLIFIISGIIVVSHICFPKFLLKIRIFIKKIWDAIYGNTLILKCASFYVFIFLVASFFAPNILVPIQLEQDPSKIATTINGLMSPFIAIAAAILTFMAFWVQYNANQKINSENKRQQNERQFYEMLKIHNDNVKSLYMNNLILLPSRYYSNKEQWQESTAKGKQYMEVALAEFNFIYSITREFTHINDNNQLFHISYTIFYFGIEYAYKNKMINIEFFKEFQEESSKWLTDNKDYMPLSRFSNIFFKGHITQLNSYYRHLFLIVKTIINIDDKIFDYSEKRQFLRILRAQLTSAEQVLLFYNWKSGCGGAWEGKTPNGKENHFFTDYRMIHNINPNNCVAFNKYELMTELTCINPNFKYEGDSREKDPLFELIE